MLAGYGDGSPSCSESSATCTHVWTMWPCRAKVMFTVALERSGSRKVNVQRIRMQLTYYAERRQVLEQGLNSLPRAAAATFWRQSEAVVEQLFQSPLSRP